MNEITDISGDWADPNHDAAGNMVSGPKGDEPAKRLHLVYDAWNRLAKVYADDGDTAGTHDANDTLRATYRYDGLHRRVRRIVVGFDGNSTPHDIYYGGWPAMSAAGGGVEWQMLEVRRFGDTVAYEQFLWGARYIDSPICRWHDADNDGTFEPDAGEMHYYTNGANFNITALLDANSGDVVERYLHDPYGRRTVLNGHTDADPNVTEWHPDGDNRSDYDNPLGHQGLPHDPESGFVENRHRYRSPTGRWLQRDPLRYVDGTNLYACCQGTPLNGRDPRGLKYTISDIGKVVWTLTHGPTRAVPPRMRKAVAFVIQEMEARGHRIDLEALWFRRYDGGDGFAVIDCYAGNPSTAEENLMNALREWAGAGVSSSGGYFMDIAEKYVQRATSNPADAAVVIGEVLDFLYLFSSDSSAPGNVITPEYEWNEEGLTDVADIVKWLFTGGTSMSYRGARNEIIGGLHDDYMDSQFFSGQMHHLASYMQVGWNWGNSNSLLYRLMRSDTGEGTGDIAHNQPPYKNGDVLNYGDYRLSIVAADIGNWLSKNEGYRGSYVTQIFKMDMSSACERNDRTSFPGNYTLPKNK